MELDCHLGFTMIRCFDKITFSLILFFVSTSIFSQRNVENQLADSLTSIANSYTYVGRISIAELSIDLKSNRILVVASEKFAYMPFRPDNVKRIYGAILKVLSSKYSNFKIVCQVEKKNIEDLIPNYYRKLSLDSVRQFKISSIVPPLLKNASRPYQPELGLLNKHIALWQSHGLHYDQKLARWQWQRARVLQTVEDLYTQSFVLPYLAPMLENAGANIFIPRERDTQTYEVIVDNDSKDKESRYREHNDRKSWKVGEGLGFANPQKKYLHAQNPFQLGTYRVIQTVFDKDEYSWNEWIPSIPEAGLYAVYVSYKSFPNSVSDAHYTVYHKGGKTEFLVNQTMYGGSWLYLGHFLFDKGRSNLGKVVLTNNNLEDGKVVTADAVKFGGGMGNMARTPFGQDAIISEKEVGDTTNDKFTSTNIYEPEVSGYPRFAEGARYWLQWAGIPDSIYSRSAGKNDYTDDFQSRANWVNFLVAGSSEAPTKSGMNVPIDLAFAFHSDAGSTSNDSIIGTLGICTIQNSTGQTTFQNGVSRWASRDLTDIIQTQIVNDVRKQYTSDWTRRGIWNKSYSESRVPEVPTMLLELLSHQNFADMRYGLDPRFRFSVSRSIYKGMLKYLSSVDNVEYVVQPLPVDQFCCKFVENSKVELHWESVVDSLEPTAKADQYIIYTRIDDGGFDNGVVINSNGAKVSIQPGKVYSFKVAALNKGGESFPSEILSAYRAPNEKGEVLIVNGFQRLSGPANFRMDSISAGFLNDEDAGVPYLSDISFVGKQYEFKLNKPWVNDDAPGFGASHANCEAKVIAGNSFDYPYLHGLAIKKAGYSFVSSSVRAIVNKSVDLGQFKAVDLIMGKQKQTFVGNAKKIPEFKTFPLALQSLIRNYCEKGGNLLLSGSYIASDLCDGDKVIKEDRLFLENVLKIKFRTAKASVGGEVKIVDSPNRSFRKMKMSYYDHPNSTSYYVQSPDAIEPVGGEGGFTICRYAENNLSAAVTYSGKYKTCVFGFPFETIDSEKNREKIMESVLKFFFTVN